MGRLFGTDGVRGRANTELTAELALDLSVAAAHVLGEAGVFSGHRPLAVVGRDTRISGEFLEAAVVAGLLSAGVDVLLLGVLPTPGHHHYSPTVLITAGVQAGARAAATRHHDWPDVSRLNESADRRYIPVLHHDSYARAAGNAGDRVRGED